MGKHHHARRQRARALSLRSFAGHSPHRPAARLPRASSPRRFAGGSVRNAAAGRAESGNHAKAACAGGHPELLVITRNPLFLERTSFWIAAF